MSGPNSPRNANLNLLQAARSAIFSEEYNQRVETMHVLSGEMSPRVVEAREVGGDKGIGFWGGFCLILNNITGPGMVSLVGIYTDCGWLVATGLMCLFGVFAGLSCGFLCDAMTCIRGNEHFEERVEMMYLAEKLLHKYTYWLAITAFIFNLMVTLVSSIVESAQTMDRTFITLFGKSCALEFGPHPGFLCVADAGGGFTDSAFGSEAYVLSLGFVFVACMAIPLGYFNVEDNIYIQMFSAGALFLYICMAWLLEFGKDGLHFDTVPAVGKNIPGQVGNLLFNYAYVVTIPSWVNEKAAGVSVQRGLWLPLPFGVLSFILLGWFGAAALGPVDDLLSKLSTKSTGIAARVATYMFPPIVLVSSIPIFSIIIKYNLEENKVFGKRMSEAVAILMPWAVALVMCAGSLLDHFNTWGSLLTAAPLNFMLPCYLFYLAHCKRANCLLNLEPLPDSAFAAGTGPSGELSPRDVLKLAAQRVAEAEEAEEDKSDPLMGGALDMDELGGMKDEEQKEMYVALPCLHTRHSLYTAGVVFVVSGAINLFAIGWQLVHPG